MRDVRVPRRVELVVVDPVDDPVELVSVGADDLVEPLAELGPLDLGRVALADGVDHVGEMDAAPEHVDDVVEARDAHAHESPLLEPRQREGAEPVRALRREVVDRERGRHVGQRAVRVEPIEQVRDERGLPVVNVDHVGQELERPEHLQHRAREVDEARVVVSESVEPVAVVKLRAVDEVDRHVSGTALEDRRLHGLRAKRHLQPAHTRLQPKRRRVDPPVPREHSPHVVTEAAQLLG